MTMAIQRDDAEEFTKPRAPRKSKANLKVVAPPTPSFVGPCPICNGRWKDHGLCMMVHEARTNIAERHARGYKLPEEEDACPPTSTQGSQSDSQAGTDWKTFWMNRPKL